MNRVAALAEDRRSVRTGRERLQTADFLGPRRLLAGSLLAATLMLAAACGGGGGTTAVSSSPTPEGGSDTPAVLLPPPNPESGPEAIGVFAGFTGDRGWTVTGLEGGSDGGGGIGGGADGGGGVGAGGSLGQFRNALVYATLDDGTRLGPATTDPITGLVTIRPGRTYAGSLLVELIGQGGSEYFDEAKNAWVAFPAGQKLRAHVPAIRANIGLTPFSEAAVGHADADRQLSQLPPAQRARESNERIRLLLNGQLPAVQAVADLTLLPVLINADSGKGALPDTPAGRYGAVIAAFTVAASQFNPALAAPGLSIATQLAKDLVDARLDGAGSDGGSLAPTGQQAYVPTELPGRLVASLDTVNRRFGPDVGSLPAPQTVGFGGYVAAQSAFTARLMSDGSVLVRSASGAPEAPLPVEPTIPSTALAATALFSDGQAMLVRRVDGSVQAVGTNPIDNFGSAPAAFRFGVAEPTVTTTPVAVAGPLSQPDGATEIVFGSSHLLARTIGGKALAWGSNDAYQLGLEESGSYLAPQTVPLSGEVRSVAASIDFSLALFADGRVFSWGTERQGALGRGPNVLFLALPGPVQVAGGGDLTGTVSIVASGASALAVRSDGSVWGWGLASQGLLGDEAASFRYLAAPVKSLSAVRKIVPVQGGAVALDESGAVFYWGLGADRESRVLPARLADLPPIRDLQRRDAGAVVALGFKDDVVVIGAFGTITK